MNGSNAAIAPCLEQAESQNAETVGQHISKSELFDNIARESSVTQKLQSVLGSQTTIFVPEEDISPSSESCLDIAGLFPEKLPKPAEARYAFSVLQEWEGHVLSIAKDTFTARLVDVTTEYSNEEEEADFPLDDLENADRSRIRAGAIFRWIIGYRRGPGGTKGRESRIVFRNLPAWTRKELERNRRDAAGWASALREE